MIPPAKRGGRPRDVNVREVLNAIFYVLWTGCQWQALPKDLPPKSTAHDYFDLWDWGGTLERIHHVLYVRERQRQGREASPTAAVIDSQTSLMRLRNSRCFNRNGFSKHLAGFILSCAETSRHAGAARPLATRVVLSNFVN